MATSALTTDSQPFPHICRLLELPREIRLLIFRNLLVLPFRQTRLSQVLEENLTTISSIRRQVEPSLELHTQLLQTCRTFNEEGQIVLAKNHLVKVTLPSAPLLQNLTNFNMSLWEMPSNGQTSAQPIMTIDVYRNSGSAKKNQRRGCLFEMRDIHFIIRYLLRACRHHDSLLRGFISVTINRIHVDGLCNASNAAERLFLRPLYPYLNDVLGIVSCSLSKFSFHTKDHLDSIDAIAGLTTRGPGDSVMLKILNATAIYRLDPPPRLYRWDIKPALRIWKELAVRFMAFAIRGAWNQTHADTADSHIWEVTALRTLEDVDDQLRYQVPAVLGLNFGPNYIELYMTLRQLRFYIGVSYLNLSYLLPSSSFERDLSRQCIIASNDPTRTTVQCTPTALAKEAVAHLSKVQSILPLIALPSVSTDTACPFLAEEVCWLFATAEAHLSASITGIGKAWMYLHRIVGHLTPNYQLPKLSRRWVRVHMQVARSLWKMFCENADDKQLREDGELRGFWWRAMVGRKIVEPSMKEKFRVERSGAFGKAAFAFTSEWYDGFVADGEALTELMEVQETRGCCRGSHC